MTTYQNRRTFILGTFAIVGATLMASPFVGLAHAASATNPLDGMSEIRAISQGKISTEGPVWDAANQRLIFSDIPGDTVYTYTPETGEEDILRTPSDMANGLLLDGKGGLLAADQRTRVISRMDLETGAVEPYITEYDGKPLNSPNDMFYHSSGLLYFTDPPLGMNLASENKTRYIEFNGFYARHPDGTVELLKEVAEDLNPNGVILSPDEKTLYLGISSDDVAPILAFDVAPDGSLSNEREFATGLHNDGMAIDVDGNLYIGNETGVFVYAPDGTHYGTIALPGGEVATNMIFGGTDLKTLFITSRGPNVYAIDLTIAGVAGR